MAATRVLIADDHALVREGVMAILKLHPDVEVVGQAENGQQAVEMAAALRPDIVLMDIAMPGLGGLEATVEIKKRQPEIKILVLSQYDDREYVTRFLKAGVSGYILKRAVGSDLITAIRAVSKGESYLYPSVAAGVIESYVSRGREVEDVYDILSDREKQVLKLIAEGQTHKEIAVTLGISEKTVISHHSKITEKLGLHTKAEIIKFAISKGIIKI